MTVATRSQTVSTSGMMWLEKKTVTPRSSLRENDVADVAPADGIQAAHGFIENEELGLAQKRLAEGDPLQHAFGEGPHLPIRPAGHGDLSEDRLHPVVDLGTLDLEELR